MSPLNPHVADFVAEIERHFRPREPETFWACEPAFREWLRGPHIADALQQELRAIAADAYYVGEWQPNEFVLHRGDGYLLSASLFDAPRRYIHALPFYAMYAALGAEGLHYDTYRLPHEYRNEVFDSLLRLEWAGTASAPALETVPIRSNQYAYDFRIEQPVAVVKFMTIPIWPLEWLFSRDTLHAWQANDSSLSHTQLRVAAYLLGRFADSSSLQPLKRLTEHPHHAVRWAAIQALGRLSRTEALAKLKDAVDDPHPHVRRAAAKSLEQLDRQRAV